ncbi:MAG: YihY/virulence factor BrkB family protein [Candidatus Zixiibacteriota bacterium]
MTEKILYRLIKSDLPKKVWRWFRHYFGGLYFRMDHHHVFLMAGGLAFSLFVCIIPLILIFFSVAGAILERPSIAQDINLFIDNIIPYSDYADFVKEKVFDRIDEFTIYRNLAGVIGFVGIFFAASGLFSSMRTILNTVYRLRSKQSALIGKLRDFGLVLLVLIYFLLSTAVFPILEVVKGFAGQYEFFNSLLNGVAADLAFDGVSFVIILVSFFLMYWLVPQGRMGKKSLWFSALWAAILWEIAKQLFGFYITHAITLKKIYGAYVLMIVVAFWVYYTSIIFIIGAEIGQLYRERRRKRRSPAFNK